MTLIALVFGTQTLDRGRQPDFGSSQIASCDSFAMPIEADSYMVTGQVLAYLAAMSINSSDKKKVWLPPPFNEFDKQYAALSLLGRLLIELGNVVVYEKIVTGAKSIGRRLTGECVTFKLPPDSYLTGNQAVDCVAEAIE
jgi:hypothetical protein